jgi:uncharacterized membrane protein YecN with MAPEG domain
MNLAVICSALLGALLFALGANVSRARAVAGPGGGQFPNDPANRLFKAVRAHANTAEYVPMLVVLMLLVQWRDPSGAADVACVVATVARFVLAGALLASPTLAQTNPARSAGAGFTYLSGMTLAVLAALTL